MTAPPLIALCLDCRHYWEAEEDGCVPICPGDRTEDRSHHVVIYVPEDGRSDPDPCRMTPTPRVGRDEEPMSEQKQRRTVPVRLPDDMAASLKRVAALNGITPGEQMDRAWTWWWNRWGVDLLPDLHAMVEALRQRGTPS